MTNQHDSKTFLYSACVILALGCAAGIFPIVIANQMFPDNGGYTRNVLFIRPPPGSSNPGYFVIIDEFRAGTAIDLVFHGYGALAFNTSARKATFNQAGASMRMSFAGSVVKITNLSNLVYEYQWNDSVNYIKVRPEDTSACRLVTIITFGNASIAHPPVVIEESASRISITINGTDRFLFHPATEPGTGAIDDGSASIAGNYCGYRVDGSGNLKWLLYANATRVSFKGNSL